jgi:hypothetical protein
MSERITQMEKMNRILEHLPGLTALLRLADLPHACGGHRARLRDRA